MSADLDDLKRLKVTAETNAWLQAESHTTGKSKQEIAREALHSIALEKIRAARVLAALAPVEARPGAIGGHNGDSGGRRR